MNVQSKIPVSNQRKCEDFVVASENQNTVLSFEKMPWYIFFGKEFITCNF